MSLNVKNVPFNVKIKQLIEFQVFRRKKTIITIEKRCDFEFLLKEAVTPKGLENYFSFIGV